MAHLLMVEGWVSENGNLILPLLKELGHTYTFVTRNWMDKQARTLFSKMRQISLKRTRMIYPLLLNVSGLFNLTELFLSAIITLERYAQ